jgi:hypothetical protein
MISGEFLIAVTGPPAGLSNEYEKRSQFSASLTNSVANPN